MNTTTDPIDLDIPRTIGEIVRAAMGIYARWPLLFVFLAGIVIVPYEVVFALVTAGHAGPSASTILILALVELVLVNPLIAALEMQLLIDLGNGAVPRAGSIVSRGLRVLAVVAAAQIVVGLAVAAGLVLFVLPGVYMAVRLAVAAPVAAAEANIHWPGAIRRSLALTAHNFWRVLGLLAIQGLLIYFVGLIVGANTVAGVILGLVLAVLAYSFSTLLISLLYFDLRARAAGVAA